jgi:hypothetical protein
LGFILTGRPLKSFAGQLSEVRTKNDTVPLLYDRSLPEKLILKIAKNQKGDVGKRGA